MSQRTSTIPASATPSPADAPLDEAAIANGQITAVGKQAFAEMARGIQASTAAAKNPTLALEKVIAALPEILPDVLKRTVPSASDETAGLLVTDITARLKALSA